MPKLITPIRVSEDGYYHSANGNVKRVFDTNGMGQLVEVKFSYRHYGADFEIDKTVILPSHSPSGKIYVMTKLGK